MGYKIIFTIIAIIFGSYITYKKYKIKKLKRLAKEFLGTHDYKWKPKTRYKILDDFRNTHFDILIIGGGATGMGCAIEGISRGLKVGLIEANDFGSGTSSKSTKLLHGGIRYLEKAVNNLDKSQFNLVTEALRERKIVMEMCPFLCRSVDLIFPVYKKILVLYYYLGLTLYDWISGTKSLGRSRFLNVKDTIDKFPNIRKNNLVGSVLYVDGQFYDSKFNVLLAVTSAYYGGSILNHVKLTKLIKENDKIIGAECYDKISETVFNVKCKVLVNTAGPFIDEIRKKSKSECNTLIQPSYGTHILVPAIFSPKNMGFVDPNTSDGRIAFFMNYKGKTLIGATDVKCQVEEHIKPSKEDLHFLIHEANYFTDNDLKLSKKDVLSVWTGIRPLICDPTKKDTENIVRNHVIHIENDNMVTVSGGKWTIFRLMGEQAIVRIVNNFNLNVKRPSISEFFTVLGAQGYTKATEYDLALKLSLPEDIAKHLATSYGTKGYLMSEYYTGTYTRLTDGYPYTKEEIIYCIEQEFAYKVSDVLFNRFMISYLDVRRAYNLIRPVADVMKDYFVWNQEKYEEQIRECKEMMETVGFSLLKE
ncbi:glycerol-3-phosphate dehydrogenase (GPDM) [Vairimorpha necatrix]|uniref:glycerol-3-phosphate dehydrogenase n=1 Tax=Vairimorpha necatrix TaxID=6039 RepID=A0AAX4JDP0_9MICR